MPAGWTATRTRILERDGWLCQVCGALATTVDHIRAAAEGGSDDDANLRAACERCNHRLGSALGGSR